MALSSEVGVESGRSGFGNGSRESRRFHTKIVVTPNDPVSDLQSSTQFQSPVTALSKAGISQPLQYDRYRHLHCDRA